MNPKPLLDPARSEAMRAHVRELVESGTPALPSTSTPNLRRVVSRTPKGTVFSGPTVPLLQMADIKLTPNAPKEKSNDR